MGREASQRERFLYWVLKEVQGLLSEKRRKKKKKPWRKKVMNMSEKADLNHSTISVNQLISLVKKARTKNVY